MKIGARIGYVFFLAAILTVFWAARLYFVEHAQLKALRFYWAGSMFQADQSLGYTLRPSSRAVMTYAGPRRYEVRTDDLGLRIPVENDRPRESGGIAGVGCSVMFGHGFAAEKTALEEVGRHFDLPVYNLGVPAYSPVSVLLRLEKMLPQLNPAVVIYFYIEQHDQRAVSATAPSWLGMRFQPFFVKQDAASALQIHPPLADNAAAFKLGDALQDLYIRPLAAGQSIPWDFRHFTALSAFKLDEMQRQVRLRIYEKFFSAVPAQAETLEAILTWMAGLTQRHQARLVVACVPSSEGVCPEALRRIAVKQSEKEKWLFVDLRQGLEEPASGAHYRELYELDPRDDHPNERFNAEAARYLIQQMERTGFLAAGKG